MDAFSEYAVFANILISLISSLLSHSEDHLFKFQHKRSFLHGGRNAAAVAFLVSLGIAAPANADTPMTAGLILKEMPTRERTTYIMGIVEGLAYARFRKDTLATGTKDETGAKCMYDWFYKDALGRLDRVEATFQKYADQFPSTLLAAMIKKECGE